jgi:2-haloacid dehalogenase
MERRLDFGAATRAALDYALAALVLPLADADRAALLDEYLRLKPFPDVRTTLERLAPRPRLILSNGTLAMLEPVVRHAGLADVIDGVLSVDAAGIYKPSPRVYRLASDRLGLPPERIAFISSNGWDATGAKAFGFATFWINRTGAPIERHGPAPDHVVGTLAEIVALAEA